MKKVYTLLLLLLPLLLKASDGVFDFLNTKPKQAVSSCLIIFYKPDCPYCQNMSTQLQKENTFDSALQQNFNIQKVNITTEAGNLLAKQFNVHAVPAIIKFDTKSGNYKIINGFPGVIKLASLLELQYPQLVVDKTFSANQNSDKPTSICGDGIKGGAEQCDDGNNTNGDGCSGTCATEAGYQCTGSPSNCTTICGDGIKAGAEQCDDGNVANGDGCTSTCTIQVGYACTTISNPSVCGTICGDGIKVGAEQCDDGNIVNGDGCSSACIIELPKGVAINDVGNAPAASAILDITSTNKGVLIPRLTSLQRTGIVSPAIGLMVYDITTNSFWFYKNAIAKWVEIGTAANGSFSAYTTGNIALNAVAIYPSITGENYDDNNNFKSSQFTVPSDGIYTFTTYANFSFSGGTSNTVILKIEDTDEIEYGSNSIVLPASYSGVFSLTTTCNKKFLQGKIVRVKLLETSTSGTQTMTALAFSGYNVN